MLQQRLILGGELKDEAVLKKIHGEHPRVVHFNTRMGGRKIDQIRGTGLTWLAQVYVANNARLNGYLKAFIVR